MISLSISLLLSYSLSDKSYISLEKTAKDNKRGLWQNNNPIDPKLWRRSK